MGSKSSASLAFFLLLNILFFALVTACDTCPKPKPKPKPKPSACPPPSPKVPSPSPNVPSPSPPKATCPKDTLKLGACADLLGLVNVVAGSPSETPCCSLLQGLTDLEAAICLCTAIKANILGINLNVPVSLSLLLNACEKEAPSGFQCE